MALIDVKHLSTPLKSRTSIVIIIVIALVFGIYRASTSNSTSARRNLKSEQVKIDEFYKELEKLIK